MIGQTRAGSARLNAYHGTKRQLVGSSAGQVAPAWRTSNGTGGAAAINGSVSPLSKKASQRGSKILLSSLPMDVAEAEIEELFKRTVGPIKDMFIIYNNQGRPKGMAVVTFHRPTDAGVARTKYDGKVIDGKHKLKIELVTDNDGVSQQPVKEQHNSPPSLLSRISGLHTQAASIKMPVAAAATHPPYVSYWSSMSPVYAVKRRGLYHLSQFRQQPVKKRAPIFIAVSGPRKRTKKGPKRVKKSIAQLDQEMEEYRATATGGKVT